MSVEIKIERLIEEGQQVRDAVSKVRGGDIVGGIFPGVSTGGTISSGISGYQAGKELGHPLAGALLGQEGAAGARSNWDNNVSLDDVYSGKNIAKRALQGAVSGVTGGLLADKMAPNAEISNDVLMTLAGTGALANSLLKPAAFYGLGKLTGKEPTKDRTIK